MEQQDIIINLELKLSDVNNLLRHLQKMKYSQVAVLIANIQNQTLKQMNLPIPQTETKKEEQKDV